MNEARSKKKDTKKKEPKVKKQPEKTKEAPKDKKRTTSKSAPKKASKKLIQEKTPIVKDSKKSTKEEAKGDQAPKRAWPAFFFFQNTTREKLKRDNPEMSQKELVSKLGEMWRSMSDSDKKPYLDQEKKDKARYMKEKEEFKASGKDAPVSKKRDKKAKAKAGSNGPKRAWPPFFFYQETRREDLKKENPTLNHKEIVSKLGEEWRTLTEAQKQPYVEKSVEDQKRYEVEKKHYQESKPAEVKDEAAPIVKSKSTKSSQKKKEKESVGVAPKEVKPKKVAKKARSKSAKPNAPKRPPKRPVPPPRPSGNRHSKRIKKNEEDEFKQKVEFYKQVVGKPVPELEEALKARVEGGEEVKDDAHDQSKHAEADETEQPDEDASAEKQDNNDMNVDKDEGDDQNDDDASDDKAKDEDMSEHEDKVSEKSASKDVELAQASPIKAAGDEEMAPEDNAEEREEKVNEAEEAQNDSKQEDEQNEDNKDESKNDVVDVDQEAEGKDCSQNFKISNGANVVKPDTENKEENEVANEASEEQKLNSSSVNHSPQKNSSPVKTPQKAENVQSKDASSEKSGDKDVKEAEVSKQEESNEQEESHKKEDEQIVDVDDDSKSVKGKSEVENQEDAVTPSPEKKAEVEEVSNNKNEENGAVDLS